jgi:hypothetical protein
LLSFHSNLYRIADPLQHDTTRGKCLLVFKDFIEKRHAPLQYYCPFELPETRLLLLLADRPGRPDQTRPTSVRRVRVVYGSPNFIAKAKTKFKVTRIE